MNKFARKYNIRYAERRKIIHNVILRLLHRVRERGDVMPDRRIDVVIERRTRIVQNNSAHSLTAKKCANLY